MTGTSRRTVPRSLAALVALTASLGLLLTGCAGPATPSATPSPVEGSMTPTPEPSPEPTLPHPSSLTPIPDVKPTPVVSPTLPVGPVSDATVQRADVQAAIAAEAGRRGVRPDEVEVAGYADVTWSDGAIGCPQPGVMYTQALVAGHQLILRVGDELASYHAAQGRPFAYCENPSPPASGSID